MKRQGLMVTIGQLRRVANEIEEELKEQYKKINAEYPSYVVEHQQQIQINIINYKGLSDTWELEEESDKGRTTT